MVTHFFYIKPPPPFLYLSNESTEQPVYFDNFTVLHDRKRLLEETHYYADGLKMEALCARAYDKPHNPFGYQDDYSEEEDETGYNEFDLRLYDPQTGRWISTDPYDQFASPYVGMGNDPVNNVDPNGGFVWDAMAMVWGGIGGFIAGGAIAMANGDDPVNGALMGALGGTALGALGGDFAAGGRSAAVTAGVTVAANLGTGMLSGGGSGQLAGGGNRIESGSYGPAADGEKPQPKPKTIK